MEGFIGLAAFDEHGIGGGGVFVFLLISGNTLSESSSIGDVFRSIKLFMLGLVCVCGKSSKS